MARKHEHDEHCKEIANTLERYAYGQMYRCDNCGEIVDENDVDDFDEISSVCPHCEEETSFEQLSMYDFLEDALDFEYTINANGDFKHGRVMLTCGGPNIYANTGRNSVELYWWGDSGEYPISNNAADILNEYLEDFYNCCKC